MTMVTSRSPRSLPSCTSHPGAKVGIAENVKSILLEDLLPSAREHFANKI